MQFKNYFCDSISCALGEFINPFIDFFEEDILNKLSKDDVNMLVKYAVIKNKIAGVTELFIKVPFAGAGRQALDEFGLGGKEIISAKQMYELNAKDFVGDRVMLMIEDLMDYKEGYLLEISDFLAKADMPVLICLGRDLEEVGRLVNRYNSSPALLLENFGFLDRKCYIYGLNFIDKDDQKILANYNPLLIFSPRSDGEEGKGAINLYNFIYNHLKFGFSSGKCYNINMPAEGKLALLNTNNLMFDNRLINCEDIINSLSESQIEVKKGNKNVVLDENYHLKDEKLENEYLLLQEKIKDIVKKIKE